MLKKDKVKVIDEQLSDEKLQRFLTLEPYGDDNVDFHILTKAYRGLPLDAFGRFLVMFLAENRDINAKDTQGRTFTATITDNANQHKVIALLKQNGAQ